MRLLRKLARTLKVPPPLRRLGIAYRPFSSKTKLQVAGSRHDRPRAGRLAVGDSPHPFRSWSTTTHAYQPLKDVDEGVDLLDAELEDPDDYAVGGYHPTVIGDAFHNRRYEIVHKLGFDACSTTWLAQDKDMARYVALKILVASETCNSVEADILRHLSDSASTHRGRSFVASLINDFAFDGPNGRHICLVQEPVVCSIEKSKESYSAGVAFPAETARSIAAQLILGLSYLHACGVCHGGGQWAY
jgi:hypothetical protein